MRSGLPRRTVIRRFAAAFGLLTGTSALGGFLSSCAAPPAASPAPESKAPAPQAKALRPIKFTLSWIPDGEFADAYAAKKLGYWQQRGLDVDIQRGFGSGTAAKQTGLGQWDFGVVDMGAALGATVDGLDLVSIAVKNPRSPQGAFWLKKTNIAKPKDLEGRSVGVTSGGATQLAFEAFATKENLDKSKIKMVALNPDVKVQALLNGEVDVVADFITLLAPLVVDKTPFSGMMFADYGLDQYNLTYITQGKTVKEQPDLVQAFVDGAMEGQKLQYLEPEKALDIFLEMVPEAGQAARDKDINRVQLLMTNSLGMVPSFEQNGLGYHDPQVLAKTIDSLSQYLKWKQKPNAETSATNRFVGKVKLTPAEWEKAKGFVKEYTSLRPTS